MNKNQADSLKTRNRLIQAALMVFDRKGVARTSLNEIATEAGLTRGALYWHFKNKEDIFAALCEEKLGNLAIKLAPPQGENATWEEEYSGFYRFFAVLEQDEEMQKFLRIIHLKCEHTEYNQAILHVLKDYYHMRDTRIRHLIEHGKQLGKLPETVSEHLGMAVLRTVLIGLEVSWLTCADFPLSEVAKVVFEQCVINLQNTGSLKL